MERLRVVGVSRVRGSGCGGLWLGIQGLRVVGLRLNLRTILGATRALWV